MSEGPSIPEGVVIDPDVVETAALAHDIGHPPFGHVAEQELNNKIEHKYNVHDGFEGNAQSFRVVTRLSINHSEGEGLDLTLASLNAILKYPWKRGPDSNEWGVDESRKWGVYKSDTDAFEDVRQLSSVEKRRSAEADIMDWADDLAYAVHDMEDFYRAGIIPLDQLLINGSQERQDFIQDWSDKKDDISVEEGDDILDYLGNIAGKSLETPYSGTEAEQLDLKELSSRLISRYLGIDGGGVELQKCNDSKHFLQVEEYLENEVSLLKHMTVYYVIQDSSLAAQQRGQQKVIGDLFDTFYNTTLPDSSNCSENEHIVPARFQNSARELQEVGEREDRVRFAADVVTSMTEQQAIQLHKRLTGTNPGSLHDRILR